MGLGKRLPTKPLVLELRYIENSRFPSTNHFSGIRADLCVVLLVRLEHMLNVGVDTIFVTLLREVVHTVGLLDEVAQTDFTRTLMRDWFHD